MTSAGTTRPYCAAASVSSSTFPNGRPVPSPGPGLADRFRPLDQPRRTPFGEGAVQPQPGDAAVGEDVDPYVGGRYGVDQEAVDGVGLEADPGQQGDPVAFGAVTYGQRRPARGIALQVGRVDLHRPDLALLHQAVADPVVAGVPAAPGLPAVVHLLGAAREDGV